MSLNSLHVPIMKVTRCMVIIRSRENLDTYGNFYADAIRELLGKKDKKLLATVR